MYYPHDDFNREEAERPSAPELAYTPAEAPKPKKKRTGLKIAALCLCCTLLGGAAGLGGAAAYAGWSADRGGQSTVQPDQTPGGSTIYESGRKPDVVSVSTVGAGKELTAAELFAANVGSTVGITVSTTTNFYGYTTTSAASGSGFVLTQDGYIVTNYHVIEEAAEDPSTPITVSFYNGDSYDARLVGGEKENDVAVLKIDATGLHPVVLGDSDSLVVGEAVYAIGNPLGELTFTLTDGLVSALDRVITTGSGNNSTTLNMLQTNCAINSGNSGGPLFNRYGELVGITTAKMSNSSSSSASVEGLGFAIPINDVKNIVQDLIQYGYVTGKPYMGVSVSTVTESDAKRYSLPVGALVESIESGSCAEKSGLLAGDIITAIDGTDIASSTALVAAKATYRAGDTVSLTVYRSGETLKLSLTFDEAPRDQQTQPQPSGGQTQDPYGGGNSGGNGYGYLNPFDYWPFG